jgi:Fe-S-cluster-containing dehydrogenase component
MTQQSAKTNMGENGRKKVGAVLVQGGGIAGVQASLDLANSGFKVYLVEREAAIGGMMSHLDKTFTTGDCATCIVSPKLVECARNLNIEILTMSELTDLKGEPGHIKAAVKRYPRYVDETRCNGCSECTNACPVQIPDHFDRELGKRKAIAKHYAQATPNIFGILKNGHSPCKVACPANVNVQGYVQLIKKKEYLKAVNLIRERNPLAAICGRICTHPCESKCTRGKADEPKLVFVYVQAHHARFLVSHGKHIDAPAQQQKAYDADDHQRARKRQVVVSRRRQAAHRPEHDGLQLPCRISDVLDKRKQGRKDGGYHRTAQDQRDHGRGTAHFPREIA